MTIFRETNYRNRRAVCIENEKLRVTITVEGGHVAEIFDKQAGVNPLWTPPWESREPSTYDRAADRTYGAGPESQLLSGIMGHNVCIDVFGPPSEAEFAAGMTVHGEANVVQYTIREVDGGLLATATLPNSHLRFTRRMTLDGNAVLFSETLENLSAWDRPVAWTQHVTLGPPFLERGKTQFRMPGTRSRSLEVDFADNRFPLGVDFNWPNAPLKAGGTEDLQTFMASERSAAFTTHLMDTSQETAFFVAWSPSSRVAFGYEWKRSDFPWLGIWEENCSRTRQPWNGWTITRGMEFGASPFPEPRRKMIERGSLFEAPGYRWLPGRSTAEVEYKAVMFATNTCPEKL